MPSSLTHRPPTETKTDLLLSVPQVPYSAESLKAVRVPLTRNVWWTLTGNVTYAGCQWGIFLALARLGSPEIVGQFALGFALVNPVFLLSQLQLRALQATDASHAEQRPGDYFALRLVTTVLALAFSVGLAISSGFRKETAWVVILVGLAKASESLSDVFYGHLQQHEDMPRIARSMMLRGTVSLAAVALAIWATRSAVWAAAALAVMWAFILAFHDAPSARATGNVSTRLVWDRKAMRSLAVRAFPLGLVTLLLSLDANIPRYVIAYDLGERALGLFAAIASLQAAGTVLVNALGQSAAPRLARYHHLGDRRAFRSLMARLLLLALLPGAALTVVALGAGGTVLRLLFGPDYAGERTLFVWLSFSTAIWLLTSILGYGATASRRLRFQPYALASVAVTTLAICFFAVPRYGILGSAIASALSAAVACGLYAVGLFAPDRRRRMVCA